MATASVSGFCVGSWGIKPLGEKNRRELEKEGKRRAYAEKDRIARGIEVVMQMFAKGEVKPGKKKLGEEQKGRPEVEN